MSEWGRGKGRETICGGTMFQGHLEDGGGRYIDQSCFSTSPVTASHASLHQWSKSSSDPSHVNRSRATFLHNHIKERQSREVPIRSLCTCKQLAYCTPRELSHTTVLEGRPWRCVLSRLLGRWPWPGQPSIHGLLTQCILDFLGFSWWRDFSQASNQKKQKTKNKKQTFPWRTGLFLADDLSEHLINCVCFDSSDALGWNLQFSLSNFPKFWDSGSQTLAWITWRWKHANMLFAYLPLNMNI